MKKKNLILISIIILVLSVFLLCFFIMQNNRRKSLIGSLNIIKDNIILINSYTKRLNYFNQGKIVATIQYKGAHGESLPNTYEYIYQIKESGIIFENSLGYTEKEIINNNLDILKKIKDLNLEQISSLIKDYKLENNKIIIDVNKFNDLFNTNFNNISVETKTNLLNTKINLIYIYIDNITVKIKDNRINIIKGNNNITLINNNGSYSLNVNNLLKMNVFFKDKDIYNLVINEQNFLINVDSNSYEIDTLSPSDIYNGLNLKITNEEINLEYLKKDESNNNPIIRYFDSCNWNLGR